MPTTAPPEIAASSTRRRPGGRSAKVRAAVLAATYDLALESGLGGFSIADVADRAGVHATSIYRRWGNREHLVAEALLSVVGEAAPMPDTGSLEQDLRTFLTLSAALMRTPQGRLLVRMAVTMGDDVDLAQLRDHYWSQAIANAAKIFERAADRGELAPRADAATAVEVAAGPLYMRALITGEQLDDDFIDRVVHLVLDGIRA